MASDKPQVLRVTGPVILDWGNGIRLQIGPPDTASAAMPAAPPTPRGKAGRKPSAATAELAKTMAADAAAGRPRTRSEYLRILIDAGHKGSEASAGQIVAREAKRTFGRTLGRSRKAPAKAGRGPGRGPSKATDILREQLRQDRANGTLHDAKHYARWLVDKADIGLKKARPIAYRELRAAQ